MGVSFDSRELEAIVTGRPNVLIYGDRAAAEAFLSWLPSGFATQIRELCIEGLRPGSQPGEGTAILRNVADCGVVEQQTLLRWLEEKGRSLQVIAITDRPLLDLVDRGEFDATLFYRLNMMSFDLLS